ncbi:ASCH domain-containing protein, partial [Enterococcus faecium]|uniref:ASCH domain-containing protein n=1 Tax=Enterococcus faecium TaxID=1352 RepID=UPI0039FB89F6
GEGDLTLDYWYEEHARFFREELVPYQLQFYPDMLLVCQSFEVVDLYTEKE